MNISNQIVLICTTTLLALTSVGTQAAELKATEDAKPKSGVTISQLDPETVLATNASVVVTKADFDAEMVRIPESERFEFLMSRTRIGTLIENILINKVLASEARKTNLDQQPAIAKEILNQTERVLAKARGRQVIQEMQVPDLTSSAKEVYLTQPQKFVVAAQYNPWHTLIKIQGSDKADALKRAQEVRTKVLNGANLAEISNTYSDDAVSKRKGGEIGLEALSSFAPTFAVALAKMKPGEVSEIVETQFGLHVIYLLEVLPEKKLSFEVVKPELLVEARATYLRSRYDAYLNNIRSDPSIKLNTDALEIIRPRVPDVIPTDYTPPQTIKAPSRKPSKK